MRRDPSVDPNCPLGYTHNKEIYIMAIKINRQKVSKNKSQMELDLTRPIEKDRNYHLGGKSFYFFDFDDNVAYLTTPIVIFHKETGAEKFLSSGDWAEHNAKIGKEGLYRNYTVDYNDEIGSFRFFRDQKLSFVDRITRKKQTFLEDVAQALEKRDYSWKAPSWNCFYHATFNHRPMSVITARGHDQETIRKGINLMVNEGHIPHSPNFLSIYPVTNPDIRIELGDVSLKASVAELKRAAIRESVEEAIKVYGYSDHHRFGMSDDDEGNIELITEEMKSLKQKYPEMSFFVIQVYKDSYEKREVLRHRTKRAKSSENFQQMNLI